jgi:PD-(D/E)XK nuclease superfamily
VRVLRPRRNLQIKFTRPVGRNEFVAYVDAIGTLDGKNCLLEWKTSSARYSEEPAGVLALDPQLVCYSWITGISEVAEIVFVRKRLVEVQHLQTTIADAQRDEFGRLVESTIAKIEAAEFLPHTGIRFPQNPCSSCPFVGLCLGQQPIVDLNFVRRPGQKVLVGLTSLITRDPPMPPKLNRERAKFVLAKIDEILA